MSARRVALYARTSQDKDDAYGITSQLLAMRSYIENLGLNVSYEFREEFTGTKLDRPELNKVRELIRDHQIDILVVYRADRLARMQHVAGYLLHEELFPNDVELHVVTFGGRIRPGTRDVLVFNIESAISQDERDVIVERTQRGKRVKLSGGDGYAPAWIGYGAVDKYGYRKEGKYRQTKMVRVEEELAVVHRIFDMLVHQHIRVLEIGRQFDAEGIPTPAKAKGFTRMERPLWSPTTLYHILKDEAYTGVWYANIRTEVNNKRVYRPKEDWVRLEFPELRVIDDETFQKAQELLAEGRRQLAPEPHHAYLMARRLRCSCGYAISVRTELRKTLFRSYYYCTGRPARRANCRMPFMRGDIVDSKTWECVVMLLKDPRAQLSALQAAQQKQQGLHNATLEQMQAAQHTIQECERMLEVYADQEAEGLISRAMLRKKKAELDIRKQAAQQVYSEYEAKVKTKIITDEEIAQTVLWLETLKEAWIDDDFAVDYDTQQQVIAALNIRGEIKIEEVEGRREQVMYLTLHSADLARAVIKVLHGNPGGEGTVGEDSLNIQTNKESAVAPELAPPASPSAPRAPSQAS